MSLGVALFSTACVEATDEAPCTGTPLTCESFTRSDRCLLQEGCALGTGCLVDQESCGRFTDEVSCGDVSGCAWTTGCTGESRRCYLLREAELCDSQVGCVWQNTDRVCYGTRTYCEDLTPAQCPQQIGCELATRCEVTTTTCAGLDSTTCAQRPTCVWGDGCLGEPAPCHDMTTKSSCDWQAGCQWQ